MTIEWSK